MIGCLNFFFAAICGIWRVLTSTQDFGFYLTGEQKRCSLARTFPAHMQKNMDLDENLHQHLISSPTRLQNFDILASQVSLILNVHILDQKRNAAMYEKC